MPRYQVTPRHNDMVIQRVTNFGATIERQHYREGDIVTIDAVDAAQLLADKEVVLYTGLDPDSLPYKTRIIANPAAGNTDPFKLPTDEQGVLRNDGTGVLTWMPLSIATGQISADPGNDIILGGDGKPYFAEAVTGLTLVGHDLQFVNETGATTTIDLSPYASNLARVVSASLNTLTGVATFTRNDASTFNLDLSALLPGNPATAVSPASDDPAGAVGTDPAYARGDHKHPAQRPSSDIDNALTVGTDGLHFLDIAEVGGNTITVGDERGSNAGPVPANPPATPKVGDLHVEFHDDYVNWFRQSAMPGFWQRLMVEPVALKIAVTTPPAADDATGAVGVAPDAARSDHKHPAQAPSADAGNAIVVGSDGLHFAPEAPMADAVSPAADDATGAVGVSLESAREDHKHPAQAPSSDPGNGITVGSDGLHYAPEAPMADGISPAADDATGAVGISLESAREDHKHPAQAPSADPGNAIAVGADGLHYAPEASFAAVVSPAADDATGAVGVSTDAAREDHKHPAQAPSADAGNAIVVGSDGLHFAPEPQLADAVSPAADGVTGVVGVSTEAAREDHKHPAQKPSTDLGNSITVGSDGLHYAAGTPLANSIPPAADNGAGAVGVSGEAAREDHKHPAQVPSADPGNAITVGSDGLHYSASAALGSVVPPAADDLTGANGTASQAAREDHKHPAQPPSSDPGNGITLGSDGLHFTTAIDFASTPSPAADDAVGIAGTTLRAARQDHKHPAQGVSADVGNEIAVGSDGLHYHQDTVTQLVLDPAAQRLTYTDEAGVANLLDMEMTGATAAIAGMGGTVPAPAAGDEGKVLSGAGTWIDPLEPRITRAMVQVKDLSGTGLRSSNFAVHYNGVGRDVDTTGSMNTSNGVFYAPRDGVYDVRSILTWDNNGPVGDDTMLHNIEVNGAARVPMEINPGAFTRPGEELNTVVHGLVRVDAGDQIRITVTGVSDVTNHKQSFLTIVELSPYL
ncbi:hypothetical protein [Sulfitobacter sp. 1A15106]|uniref:hypothetical protein n=1 Tax=Sulfitobacter sp. 1A15106 TaxID=3368590 RepID=UPI003746F52C